MNNQFPKILALDFDGVVCDGLIEYFQTTKRTYQQIWTDDFSEDLDRFAPLFYQLRPVVETGWEMPILLRGLVLGFSSEEISQDWPKIVEQILTSEHLDRTFVSHQLDQVRDHWIESDLEDWLGLHRFYSGVPERLIQLLNSSFLVYIVTTKEGRFVKQLLQSQGVDFPQACIIGKEVKQPKYKTLGNLLEINQLPPDYLWFVEDLLPTLLKVKKQDNLKGVGLYLADWGYNTQQTRDSLVEHPEIKLLSLDQFSQDFFAWL
jgi:phosphoglycolate phosphatase-like HAD superfamily hydrolase